MMPARATSVVEQRRAAVRRHPANGWQPSLERMRLRMAWHLAEHGAVWPEFAAEVMCARARLRLEVCEFADLIGASDAEVLALEAGLVAPADVSAETLSTVRRACTA